MAGEGFVHLHNHTEFSMLDGAARIPALFAAAERMGMPALAITDHGNMFGAYEFYKASKATGVKPIIGLEAYLTPKTHRSERKRVQFGDGTGDDVAAKGAYTHMTILSQNNVGMHNLFRLSSRSSLEGYFYKPRADRELLQEYHEGLLATTGCPSGEVQTYLRLGNYQAARESAAEFADIFGRENFFVELMDHGLSIERSVRHDLLRLAKDLGLGLVASNDLHYTTPDEARVQDVLLCINSGSRLDTPGRFKFDGSGYYLKSAAEMRALFADVPEACDNTLAIAERCQISFDEGSGTFMPHFPLPPGETEASWFSKEVERGLAERYGTPVPPEVMERYRYEAEIIVSKGYAGYYLVVADFIGWAKRNGIRVGPGRGSGAGSICAYAMRITDLCPLRHELLFERFLNPERPSLPDFDVDFDERRRADVIAYVSERYGSDRVCQIVTYGTIKAKQAVKDAARVLDKPFALGERLTKAMPPAVMGKDVPLADLFNPEHERYNEGGEFRELYNADPEIREVVDTGMGIEGLKRQWGVHAAGVIMSSVPLTDVVPIMKREQDGAIITQFDYPGAEALGLVKMDFLGLRNLTILDDAIANVKANRGVQVDLEELSRALDDQATYDLLTRGDTLGVFQFDSTGYQQLCRTMRPDNFNDVVALGALYRPGPMGTNSHTNYALRKNHQQAIDYIHPELTDALIPILADTFGLTIYQEHVLKIAQQLAGYSLGKADLLRKAMGKKKKEVLDAEYLGFEAGMRANGFSPASIKAVWDVLVPFAGYAFNKAHAAAYGLVSYWTAWLKAHYPTEYMAALLQSVKDDKDKSAIYLAECRRMGIKVLLPDVNESVGAFTPVGEDIRFGLSAIRNVGDNVVAGIITGRQEHGPARDFYDFLDHSPLIVCNKRVIESLIKAGAFDSLGHQRRALMEVFESAVDQVIDLKRNQANGQDDLFGESSATGRLVVHGEVPAMDDWDKRTRLAFEREMLGLYVSDHPLLGLEHVLRAESDISIGRLLADGPRDGSVTIAGMITAIQRRQNRAGNLWAIVTVEDLEASVDVMVWPKTYESVAGHLATDIVVKIRGRVRGREEGVELQVNDLTVIDVSEGPPPPVIIQLPATRCNGALVSQLREILVAHPGMTEVRVLLLRPGRPLALRVGDGLRVTASAALMADLKALLGPSCVAAHAQAV